MQQYAPFVGGLLLFVVFIKTLYVVFNKKIMTTNEVFISLADLIVGLYLIS